MSGNVWTVQSSTSVCFPASVNVHMPFRHLHQDRKKLIEMWKKWGAGWVYEKMNPQNWEHCTHWFNSFLSTEKRPYHLVASLHPETLYLVDLLPNSIDVAVHIHTCAHFTHFSTVHWVPGMWKCHTLRGASSKWRAQQEGTEWGLLSAIYTQKLVESYIQICCQSVLF